MAGDVRYCQNCRRNIAAANYVIHSVHCERKIQLCTVCDEPVPRTEMEQHLENNHSMDACELCGLEMEKWKMESHKDICCKRLTACNFCELEHPFDELHDHKNMCGSRTEKCSVCKAYVKLKDQDVHRKTCLREQHASVLSECVYCKKSVPINLYHKHITACGSQTEKCLVCGDFVVLRDKDAHVCQGSCVPCMYCDTSIPVDILYEHVSACGERIKCCPKCNASFMLKDRNTHECQSPSKTVGNCSICQESVPWIDLREHESACRLASYVSDEDEDKPKFSAIPMHQKKQASYRPSDSRTQKRMTETPNIHKLTQCLYCKERFPDLIAADHLRECGQRPSKCELCLKTILLKDKLNHETRDCQMVQGTNEDISGNENSYSDSAVASGYTRSYEKKLKQCPFCQKKFPEIMFHDHLGECEESPYQCSLCLKMMPVKSKINHELKECSFTAKIKRRFSGSEREHSSDAPVYKKSFERGYLENNSQTCPYCNCRIPEAKIAEHLQCCSEGKKPCRFCGKEIPIDQETVHLQNCIGARNVVEEQGFQVAGGKKNKKKNKKGKQNEPEEQKGWFSSIFSNRNLPSTPVKEYAAGTFFQSQMTLLPCEFCNELFPDSTIIEHQTGCQPDLVSYPKDDKEGHSGGRRTSPEKNAGDFMTAPKKYRDAKSTGALPKRNRFNMNDSDITPGEFLSHPSAPKVPVKERDYYNYPSGLPDFSPQPKDDAIKQGRKAFQARESMLDSKATCESEDKKAKNSASAIFNFSSSSRNSSSHQLKSPPTPYSYRSEALSPIRKGHYEAQRAVGAERAEKKGIVRISRDTPDNFNDTRNESPDEHDTNYQIPKNSQNSGNKFENKDIYSSKLQFSGGRFNIPFADETSNVIESEKLKSTCATRLLETSNNSFATANNPEACDITEDDAKNEETFGSDFNPKENFSMSGENDNSTDSGEYFYDAEENLKVSNIESGSSFMDTTNLENYLQYLMKDESMTANGNKNERLSSPVKEKTFNCECGNKVCYCNIINRPSATENNNHLQTEPEDFEGHLRKQKASAESMLKTCSNAKSANNFQCEEIPGSDNRVNCTENEKCSPKWNDWRSNLQYSSDSD